MDNKLKLDPRVDFGPQLNLTVWMLVSVSALFLFTRLYLKNCQNRGLWWDDYALLASWMFLSGEAGLLSYVIGLGYGKQVIPMQNLDKFGLVVTCMSTTMVVANMLGKVSFAMTLLRIPSTWMRIALAFLVVTMVGSLSGSVLMIWTECLPPLRTKQCVPPQIAAPYNLFACGYSAAVDVALAFLPWKYIWSLEMSRKEKMGVVIAMSMGVFAGVAAVIKTLGMLTVGRNPGDPTSSVQLVAWGNAEAAICIMAASIPILRALFRNNVAPGPPVRPPETGETTFMTESTQATQATVHDFRARIFSQLAVPAPPPTNQRQVDPRNTNLDETLTSGSPVPAVRKNRGLDGDDWSDQDSFEMTNYYHRPRPESPTDFTRRGLQ
ncbi:hypothetical protein V8F20_006000 [Naviculisporaceae sp. PSN 640]